MKTVNAQYGAVEFNEEKAAHCTACSMINKEEPADYIIAHISVTPGEPHYTHTFTACESCVDMFYSGRKLYEVVQQLHT
jgi:uncharacterized protein with PIN domain